VWSRGAGPGGPAKVPLDAPGARGLIRRMVAPLTVQLGARAYPIHFGDRLGPALREELARLTAQGRRVAVVTDEAVRAAQGAFIAEVFGAAPVLALPPGESAKSLAGLERVLAFLAAERLDRGGVVVAYGGGVIGDLAGFAAAAWLRGVDFLQVPTTLLAMVDSSVGGKTGINVPAGKNLVGAFHQPRAVYIDTGLLATLPAREFAAGMAEVVKYGLLGDAALFARLEAGAVDRSSADLPDLIRRCCALKARIVEADERELAADGGRALLNLGHTFGHAVENVAGYGEYLHGEAVAIGLSAAARLSVDLGLVPAGVVGRVERVLTAHRLPVRLARPLPWAELLAAMRRDKKVRAGGLRFVVLAAVGEAATRGGVPLPPVEAAFRAVGAA